MSDRQASLLVANGALVFLLGMLAGFPFAFLLLGKIALWPIPGSIEWTMPGDVRGWRMAHLEGVLNGLTLIGVAAVAPRLRLRERTARVLTWSLLAMAWGNQVASLIGPIFGGRGLEFGKGVANSLMYLLFVAAIVGVLVGMWIVFRGAMASLRGDGVGAGAGRREP
jgi:hypothetical protein